MNKHKKYEEFDIKCKKRLTEFHTNFENHIDELSEEFDTSQFEEIEEPKPKKNEHHQHETYLETICFKHPVPKNDHKNEENGNIRLSEMHSAIQTREATFALKLTSKVDN